MNKLNVVLFLCNWGPHAAFQTLQDQKAPIPEEIRMVRVPCSGRVTRALILKCFEMGADGVLIAGCEPGSCRYGTGNSAALTRIDHMRRLLHILGVGSERLRWAGFLPDDAPGMMAFLESFCHDLRRLGKTPIVPPPPAEERPVTEAAVANLLKRHDIYACQDCGKCSSACPLTLTGKPFSPRGLATHLMTGAVNAPEVLNDLWGCITCGLCDDRCPSGVHFPDFIRDLRTLHRSGNGPGPEAHGGFFQSLMRTMTSPSLHPNRWEDVADNLDVDPESPVLFFGGCAPYFDTYFTRFRDVHTEAILHDAIRLLNFFDIRPRVLTEERCCGHDLLWSGDRENFVKLAQLNADMFHAAGVEEIITACPECYYTLTHHYAEFGIALQCRVTHIFDVADREIAKGAIGFKALGRKATFQDPCRLSRLDKKADLPRKLIGRLALTGFGEMTDRGASALCCGNCAWTGCDRYTKALQLKRLRQAKDTGSDLLITACPKCQIHLRCAMEDPFHGNDLAMDMMDLTSLLAKTIQWE